MTFLELCKRVRQESGVSGTGPVSVASQTGILAKIVEWVRQADVDIQRYNLFWSFLWRITDVELTLGTKEYSMAALGLSDMRQLKGISIGNNKLVEMPWQLYVDYGFRLSSDSGTPTHYTFRPDGVMCVHPAPNAPVQVTIEYYRTPKAMSANADVSLIPEAYHDAIIHKALMYFASHEEDAALLQVSNVRYENVLAEMGANYLPKITLDRGRLF